MNPAVTKLIMTEARRLWTIPTIVLTALLVVIGWSIAVLPMIVSGPAGRSSPQPLDAAGHIFQVENGLLLLATLFVAAGIVAYDTRSGWMRSLLTRPVTRQEYLAVKILTVSCSIVLILFVASVVPIPVLAVAFKLPVVWNTGQVLGILGGMAGQCFTFVAMSAVLSCMLPGVSNVAFLFVWQFISSLVEFLTNRYFWSNPLVYIMRDVLFPQRFSDGAGAIVAHRVPLADFIWGLGILSLFLSLGFWLINRIQVDRTSD